MVKENYGWTDVEVLDVKNQRLVTTVNRLTVDSCLCRLLEHTIFVFIPVYFRVML